MLSGYLGLFLVAASFLSIGLLTSSLTENQIVAAVSCLVALLLLYVITWPAETSTPTIGAVLHYLSLTEHFSELVKGVIDTRALVYFVSLDRRGALPHPALRRIAALEMNTRARRNERVREASSRV